MNIYPYYFNLLFCHFLKGTYQNHCKALTFAFIHLVCVTLTAFPHFDEQMIYMHVCLLMYDLH